jgi:cysteinyl-tRNA synthetase
LTGKVEEFQPTESGKVRMYSCGPTVYDFAHIGNFRTFVFQDILRRVLRTRGYDLLHVMNITDVDDRIIENSIQSGDSIEKITRPFEAAFLEDSAVLGIEQPEKVIRATEHIQEMVELIQRIVDSGAAYESDGSVYFSIQKFADYGKLARLDMEGLQPGARIEADRYEKSDPRDFVLWKASKPGEPSWEAPFGPGRPGWHIECSAMSMKYLGETIDIHTGGSDLIFPHHTNEIAQSEAATGKPFVRFWLHGEFLQIEKEKMSKSLGNFHTVRDLLREGHKPTAIRYLLASVPYRRQLNFTKDALHQASQSIERLHNFLRRLRTEKFPQGRSNDQSGMSKQAEEARQAFDDALDDDLNTAGALGAVFNIVRDANTAMDRGEFRTGDIEAVEELIRYFDSIFSVLADDRELLKILNGKIELPETGGAGGLSDEEVEALIAERQQARAGRDFARSDEIRDQLAGSGIIVEDAKGGVRWRRK